MELKSESDVEVGKPQGLKLVGQDIEDLQKKKAIGDMETWDFSVEDQTYYVTSAKSKLQREAKAAHETPISKVVLKIFQVIVYMAILFEMGTLAMICMQDGSTILYGLKDHKTVFTVVALVLVLDSILVNVMFEIHPSLLFVALVLPFLYPWCRGNYVSRKNGIGTLASGMYFLSICFTLGSLWTAYLDYGDLIKMEDRNQQERIVACYHMTLDTGATLGEFLKKNFADVEITPGIDRNGEYVYILIKGNGYIYLKDDGFVTGLSKEVPSTLKFTIENGGNLTLSAVTLRNDELTENGLESYWGWVAKKK